MEMQKFGVVLALLVPIISLAVPIIILIVLLNTNKLLIKILKQLETPLQKNKDNYK
ncbi:hypothetical protein [Thermosyntropha sp.]|uniref:hypothetical protein n=1 Tax=Thermosyntropha sp. TaxID=2740820 RepID=UPI0025D539E8|nr:hypothetical protein [Thermosyntropha sp.]MBO8158936.1 hypothetical protein [Thermosyntropha sp.]